MGGVFVVKDQEPLVAMQPACFAKEEDFQRLLAKHPDLLAGDQVDPDSPRRWLLVSRETAIPSEDGGAARWAVDHLFLDQDGIPTLVEVKRQSNTELRRQVVGQLLEYAANATAYWTVETIREKLLESVREHCKDGKDEVNVLAERLGVRQPTDEFWQKVKTNLQAGRLRLLFVADSIPSELRRIVEFLNAQMDPAEVLALELRQYEGAGMRTIVPLLYGQRTRSPVAPVREWTEEEVLSQVEQKLGHKLRAIAGRIVAWMHVHGQVSTGTGDSIGSIRAGFGPPGHRVNVITIYGNGYVEVAFQHMVNSILKDEAKRRELLHKLNAIDGINISDDAITKFPSIPLKQLASAESERRFFHAVDWFANELEAQK